MIEIQILNITKLSDYDSLKKIVIDTCGENYISDDIVDELKERIGKKCKSIIIEYPYRDIDYSSTFASFYSKKHKMLPKECCRLHFFKSLKKTKEQYVGFLILRPSFVDCRGRSYLHPELLLTTQAYLMYAEYNAFIYGEEYCVFAFPWMAQETDIDVCAHVVCWAINRYFSQKFHRFQELSVNDIVENIPYELQRKVPSEGLTLLQISHGIRNMGYTPFIISKKESDCFDESLFSYVESGIPVIAGMDRKKHVVTIIGHGEIIYDKKISYAKDIISSHLFIDSLIVADDQHLPYSVIKTGKKKVSSYVLNDIDYIIIPLYSKMMLPPGIVKIRAEELIMSGEFNKTTPLVMRMYITTAHSLKEKAQGDKRINKDLLTILLKLPTPRFVWCVDLSTREEFASQSISGRIIFDITAGTYERTPWLLYHDNLRVKYFDSEQQKYFEEPLNIEPYSIYKNNLHEVSPL